MKSTSKTVTLWGLAVAGTLATAVAFAGLEKAASRNAGNVVIQDKSIIIPGTEFSKDDDEAMNKILKQYSKSLYRIDTYVNGQRKKTQGKLSDVVTDKKLASEIATNVQKKGFTQYTVRIGSEGISFQSHVAPANLKPVAPAATPIGGGNPHHIAGPAASPDAGSGNPHRILGPVPSPNTGTATNPQRINTKDSEELVRRLKPILAKYSNK
jgi:hypothetical protein